LISSLKDPHFAQAFVEETSFLDSKSISLTFNLTLLNCIQTKWLHLQPFFVKKTLPDYQDAFDSIDQEF
jgi:hypothetical protein